jgi:hypothetical protein
VAVLSREQNVAIVLIILLEALLRRCGRATIVLAIALLAWLGWIGILRGMYGVWPFLPENIGLPLAGIYYRLTHLTGARGTASSPVHAIGMLLLFLQLALSLRLLWLRPERLVILICSTGAGLAVFGGVFIFSNLESYTRVFWWMPFGIWLWSIQSGRRSPILLLSCGAVLPFLALVQAWNSVRVGAVTFMD